MRVSFERILTALGRAEVDFVVVGGVSAVLQGATTTTFDLDIVPSLEPANRRRLLEVLEELEACYREHLPKRLLPTDADLAAGGHLLLATNQGPLDVLGRIVGDLGYPELLERSRTLRVGDHDVRILTLQALIELKEQLGRAKDLAQLPVLRRALDEGRD